MALRRFFPSLHCPFQKSYSTYISSFRDIVITVLLFFNSLKS